MTYFISRDGQQYGPYSLDDLREHIAQDKIQLSDLARGDGQEQWIPVEQVLGKAASLPVIAQPAAVQPQRVGVVAQLAQSVPLPPRLHWGLVLLFVVLTFGLFSWIWIFVQASFANKLRTKHTPMRFYGIGIALLVFAGVTKVAASAVGEPGLEFFALLGYLAGGLFVISGNVSLKSALEDYYNRVEPMPLQLSGTMVFFFNVFYFQYHLNRIREWKISGGAWNSGLPVFRDLQPQPGVVHTQTELE